MDVKFVDSTYNDSSRGRLYPTRNTGYDTFEYFKRHIDPDDIMLQTCSQLVTVLIRELGDSLLLPFDLMQYVVTLEEARESLRQLGRKRLRQPQGICNKKALNPHSSRLSLT